MFGEIHAALQLAKLHGGEPALAQGVPRGGLPGTPDGEFVSIGLELGSLSVKLAELQGESCRRRFLRLFRRGCLCALSRALGSL